jgi:cardiolipin synthase
MSERSNNWTTANLLTAARILLIAPFVYLIGKGHFGLALLVFFIASVTDFIDGYLARNFGQQSALGQLLDPLADKLLTTAGFIIMAIPREGFPSIPVWLAVAVVGRDVIILLGSLVVYLTIRFTGFKPTWLGKINTFLEMGLVVIFLGFHTAGRLTFLLPFCYVIVLASVLASGASYLLEGISIFKNHRKARSKLPLSSDQGI